MGASFTHTSRKRHTRGGFSCSARVNKEDAQRFWSQNVNLGVHISDWNSAFQHVCMCARVSICCWKHAAQQRAEFRKQRVYGESAEFRPQGSDLASRVRIMCPPVTERAGGDGSREGKHTHTQRHTAGFYLCASRSLPCLTEPFIDAGTLKPRLSLMSLQRSDLLSCLLLSFCFLWMGDIISFQ